MERAELLQETRSLLVSAGFVVSESFEMRLAGFDMVARRGETLLIIKVLTNIDTFSEPVARSLRRLALMLKATPLLIGEKNGFNPLEQNAVYDRFDIQAITLETLSGHLLEDVPLWAYAGPGGFYVNLDAERIRRLRQEKNISLGEFARFVRVSRRTVQMYEDGMSARVDVAARIEEFLESSVITPIDLWKSMQDDSVYPDAGLEQMKAFQREVLTLLHRVGYKIVPMDRCPFEAVSKERDQILLTCIQEYNKHLQKKAEILTNLSRITEKQAVVFLDREIARRNLAGTPIIMKRDLKKIRDPEDISLMISERTDEQ
jgi:putative transcriptional regulator